MSIESTPWRAGILGLALLGLVAACAVGGPGYDDGYGYGDVEVGYGGGYYEPYGYDYGGWGGRYHVGPPRGGRPEEGRAGGHPGGGVRSAPSIPSRPRGR
jgi:hypothetical protein